MGNQDNRTEMLQKLPLPEDFQAAMKARWIDLDNVSSPRLEALWLTMGRIFNEAAEHSNDGLWRILKPPTGTGKTQGLCVYASLVLKMHAPMGMLVVTRTILQADEIVQTIRELAPDFSQLVRANHSEAPLNQFEIDATQVLVVTHAAYEMILAGNGRPTSWEGGARRLTVIDETLGGIVEEHAVSLDDLKELKRFIRPEYRLDHPLQIQAIDELHDIFEVIELKNVAAQREGASTKDRILWRSKDHGGDWAFSENMTMTPLRDTLWKRDYRVRTRKSTPDDCRRRRDRIDGILRNCEALLKRWVYYSKRGRDISFNSSSLLIPEGLPGPVVLDATASQNFLWKLLGDRARVIQTPPDVRRYDNVTLHVARAKGIGKHAMVENAKTRIPRLVAHLRERETPSQSLLVCHLDIEHLVLSYDTGCDVAHWWAIDGKNTWQHHDTAILLGMPYRSDTWAFNTFFATQGLQSNDWLENPSWKNYPDIRKELKQRQLTASIIQALNRIRCRRVVDDQGNSASADIFIILSENGEGDTILENLRDEMPGLKVVGWDFELDGPEVKLRRGSSHPALIALMRTQDKGEIPMSFIREELGLSQDAMNKLQKTLNDPDHSLTKSLREIGVSYVSLGRGKRSFFLKR